jgi:O-methyltransferase
MLMNKRTLALRVARYSEALDQLNWAARWRAMVNANRAGVPMLVSRYELYEYINTAVEADPITYLEFGVSSGETLRSWVKLNANVASRFVGFDTFFGLPEDWNKTKPQGSFSTGGQLPTIDDARVSFQVGLFQETLRPFLNGVDLDGRLVVHLDADLYSATLFVLTQLDARMASGTVLLFDEFQSVLQEFRAWHDYLASYQRKWKLLALAAGGDHAAVELE